LTIRAVLRTLHGERLSLNGYYAGLSYSRMEGKESRLSRETPAITIQIIINSEEEK